MTRQEYNTKAANGTLTVRDVIENREYATPEQLTVIDLNVTQITPDKTLGDFVRSVKEVANIIQTRNDSYDADLLDEWENPDE